MRILLDESLPRPLARLLPEHEVRTVAAMGWTGIRNSELLQLAAGEFDALARLKWQRTVSHEAQLRSSLSGSNVALSRRRQRSERAVGCSAES